MYLGPLLSVIIPAHNASHTLERALKSVFIQDYAPFEVIIVDDGSTDGTIDVAKSFPGGDNIFTYRLESCGGAANARNHGISVCHGELIAFLDADDEWVAGKLAKQAALILADPAMTFVSCGSTLIAPDGTDCGSVYPGRSPSWGHDVWRVLLTYNFIATPSVVVRHSALDAVGWFDTSLKVGEDQDMWIRLSLTGDVGYVDDLLVRVHETPNSLSSGNFQDQLVYTMPMISRHMDAQKDKLTPHDVRSILGNRLGRLGRAALGRGLRQIGVSLILQAIRYGDRPIGNVLLLLRSSVRSLLIKRTE